MSRPILLLRPRLLIANKQSAATPRLLPTQPPQNRHPKLLVVYCKSRIPGSRRLRWTARVTLINSDSFHQTTKLSQFASSATHCCNNKRSIMMKFIHHKGSASTIQNIQYIHMLQNENTRNYKITKKLQLKHSYKLQPNNRSVRPIML